MDTYHPSATMKFIAVILVLCIVAGATSAPVFLPHIDAEGISDTIENGRRMIRSTTPHEVSRDVSEECYTNCNVGQLYQSLGIYEDGSHDPYDFSAIYEYLDPLNFLFYLQDQYYIAGSQVFAYVLSQYPPQYGYLYETESAELPYPLYVDAINCVAAQSIRRVLKENVNNRSVFEVNVALFKYRNTNPSCHNGGNRPHVPGTPPQVTIVGIEENPNSQMLDTYLFDYLRDNVTQFCAKYEERCSGFYPNVDWADATECETYMNTIPFTNDPYGLGHPFPDNTRSCRNYPLNRLIAGIQHFNVGATEAAANCRAIGPASSPYAACISAA